VSGAGLVGEGGAAAADPGLAAPSPRPVLLPVHQSNVPPPPSDWEFSWLARNLAPVRNQKIHWASEPGSASLPGLNIANRGQIRFVRRGPSACTVNLSISYEVPEMLAPFANVSPFSGRGRSRRVAQAAAPCNSPAA
jgi:hypothetical protein